LSNIQDAVEVCQTGGVEGRESNVERRRWRVLGAANLDS
jgi:hypothetical protein